MSPPPPLPYDTCTDVLGVLWLITEVQNLAYIDSTPYEIQFIFSHIRPALDIHYELLVDHKTKIEIISI